MINVYKHETNIHMYVRILYRTKKDLTRVNIVLSIGNMFVDVIFYLGLFFLFCTILIERI